MDTFLQDLRFALRTLRRTPGLALLAVLCMGLGIGAVTSMYSTASAFTFRPLPQVRDAGRLMHVWEGPASSPDRDDGISAAALKDLRTLRVFSDVAAVQWWSANITGVDLPEQVRSARVTANALHALGRTPLLGRDFTAADDDPGAGHVALLGYGLWQRRFGGDRRIVGRVVRINGEGYTVVGVMPEDFTFPAGVELWAPLALSANAWADRDRRNFFALARLAPGVAPRQTEAAVATLGGRLASAYPASSGDWVMRAEPAQQYFGAGPRPFMMVLLAASAFVLLIACADVANLLLARATARRRELAVRIALGAPRFRIVRQQLTESVVIALAGGALGVLLALWGLSSLTTSVPAEVRAFIPGFGELHLDGRALLLTALVAVGSGILFGLVPALAAARVDVQGALKEGARGDVGGTRSRGGRRRSALVVAEVALALMLLVGAAQTLATYHRLALTDPGFRTESVLTLSVTLPSADYPKDSNVVQFFRTLEDRVTAPPVAAVSEAAAKLLWPGADPLGKRIKIWSDQWVEVVGVAGDVRGNPLMGGDTRLVVYLPERQRPARITSLVVRAAGDPIRLAPLVQREIGAVDPRLAAGNVLPMRRVIASAISPQSATAQTLAVAAIVALLMACIGLYGVMAYSVSQRTQEIGVRVALGATGAGIVRLVLGRAAVLATVGIAIGIVGAGPRASGDPRGHQGRRPGRHRGRVPRARPRGVTGELPASTAGDEGGPGGGAEKRIGVRCQVSGVLARRRTCRGAMVRCQLSPAAFHATGSYSRGQRPMPGRLASIPVRSYRDLRVWHSAMDLVVASYGLAAKMPKRELYALAAQTQRSAVSVSANIAEGHGREHLRDYIHHLSVANGSLMELETEIQIGIRLGYYAAAAAEPVLSEAANVGRMLAGLTAKLKARAKCRSLPDT